MSDEPEKHSVANFPAGTRIEHRRDLDAIQKQLREIPGVTVMIYDQTCAAEKRRRRKRGLMEDPPKRAFINELVCEGCGDCSQDVQLRLGRAAGDRVRPQAQDRPVVLQQGFLLRRGLLPQLRHRAWRRPEDPRQERRGERRVRHAAAGAAGSHARDLQHRDRRHRRHRGDLHRRDPRHRRAYRRQDRRHARHDGPGAEGRRGDELRARRRPTRRASTGRACRPARRTC